MNHYIFFISSYKKYLELLLLDELKTYDEKHYKFIN